MNAKSKAIPTFQSEIDTTDASRRGIALKRRSRGVGDENGVPRKEGVKRQRGADGKAKRHAFGRVDANANKMVTRSQTAAALSTTTPAVPMPMDSMEVSGDRSRASMLVEEPTLDWADVDEYDRSDPLQVLQYVDSIFALLKHKETDPANRPDPRYMETVQDDITAKMRGILIDWEISVGLRFELHTETLFLAVDILDRFLSKVPVRRSNLQLVGVASLLVACKYEETYSPVIKDFEYISDMACLRNDILDMEKLILTTLDFDLCTPNPLHFLRRYSKAARYDVETHTLAKYLIELTMPAYSMLRFRPSVIAASAVFLARRMNTQMGGWDDTLEHYTGYRREDLVECAREINTLIDTPVSDRSIFRWVKSKYAHRSTFSVSERPSVAL